MSGAFLVMQPVTSQQTKNAAMCREQPALHLGNGEAIVAIWQQEHFEHQKLLDVTFANCVRPRSL